MNKTITFLVKDTDKKQRLDKFLTNNLKNLTRSQVKKIITSNGVRVNNKIVVSASEKVKNGAQLKLFLVKIKMIILNQKR